MSTTWDDGERPERPRLSTCDRLRIATRGTAIAAVVFGLLPIVIALRLAGLRAAASRLVSRASRATLHILGLRLILDGRPDPQTRALVANHSSWLDIFVLTAAHPLTFVSKSDVAAWPGIGWVARGTGTVFINRRRTEAAAHRDILSSRIAEGDLLLFFPEGTSTDGRRVLRFRPTLFAAVKGPEGRSARVQPVAVVYHAPPDQDPRLYGWWGDMDFAPHFIAMLGLARHGRVEVVFRPPLDPDDFPDRKTLALAAEEEIRRCFAERLKG